ncbi:MAG: carboxypeptidase regulatory-like domain-containing protein [Bryobacteraceae bacterium]
MNRFKLAVVWTFFALLTLPLGAQIGTSTITGRVQDPTGAVIPNVTVTVVHVATNFTSVAVTNSEGLYRVPSLQPGRYRITFEAQGFMRTVREDVELRTGDTLAIDANLRVGNVAESIEITGAPPLLETETSATGTVMGGSVLYDMPLYQRYVNSTLNLVPGLTTGGYAWGGGLGNYNIAGQRASTTGLFEDGVNANDQLSGTSAIRTIQNSIAEVKVITTVPPAEYGHTAGGVLSVVKKTGTNEFHGLASWYGRTRRMQHRLYFDRMRDSQPRPGRPDGFPAFFMQPDANVSGPVFLPKIYDGRNKTFFFFGYQRLHEKKVAQVQSVTPTLGMRAGDFNFPGVNANPIFDPASTRQVNGQWVRDPFPGNRVPMNRIDPVARKVLEFDPWVQPNMPGTFNALGPVGNYMADEFALVFFNDYNLRLDHQFNQNFKIYGSYTENQQSGFGRPINIRQDRPEFDHQQGNWNPFGQRNMSLGKTWVISPTLINDARAGYYRRVNRTDVPSFGGNWPQQLGIPNMDQSLMPAFGSGGRDTPGSLYGLSGATPSQLVNETLSFRNDTTWIRGTHALKFGYEILRFRLNSAIMAHPARFNFNGVTSGLLPTGALQPNTGNYFAGFLTGHVAQADFQSEVTSWLPRSSIHSFYIQDDWKITPRLTMNIGLRYSNESPFDTKYGGMSNFDPTAVDDVTGRPGGLIFPGGALGRRDNNNFNPRIGLAWQASEKWVFRGGFGMYTIDTKFPAQRMQFNEWVAQTVHEALPGVPVPVYTLSQGPDPVRFNVRNNGSSPFRGQNFGNRGADFFDPNLRNAYSMNWNINIQRALSRNYLLETSYQGSAGVGLIERWNINTFPIDFAVNDLALRSQVLARPQDFRPFPHFGNVLMRSNFGHSTFHSGTVKLEKRMADGFFINTFYTFSKAINSQDNDNAGSGIAPIQNRSLEKARASYDRNHRWISTINWELPLGRNQKFLNSSRWMNWVFGGLEVSWIQTVESGNPLTFSFANSPYNYYAAFAGNRRPDLVSTPQIRDGWRDLGGDRFNVQNINAVVDINHFALPGGCPQTLPPAGTPERTALINDCSFRIGNAGRNIITGLPLLWSQVSAQKNFIIKERYRWQLRWDFQNALKTYNFNPPTTAVDFQNPRTFGKVSSDPRTASLGGQPLMNLTLMMQW